jgi:5-(carboxyamino)imidazole ribonucleotide mutase
MSKPIIGIIMGSQSDLDIMKDAAEALDVFGIDYEVRIISAHRTPDEMKNYGNEARGRGLKLIIAGAGGSAHLPGMVSVFANVPVLAVPVKRDHHDHEALWSNIKMPKGAPLAVMPENGAYNAGLAAVQFLAISDDQLATKYAEFHQTQRQEVIAIDTAVQKNWRSQMPK